MNNLKVSFFSTFYIIFTIIASLLVVLPEGQVYAQSSSYEIVYTYHTVKSGDKKNDIIRKYGISGSSLIRWNNLKPYERLVPGRKLIVGHRAKFPDLYGVKGESSLVPLNQVSVNHVVKYNDTFSSIAKQYGITVNQLRDWNNMFTTSSLLVGETLLVGFQYRYDKNLVDKLYVDAGLRNSGSSTSSLAGNNTGDDRFSTWETEESSESTSTISPSNNNTTTSTTTTYTEPATHSFIIIEDPPTIPNNSDETYFTIDPPVNIDNSSPAYTDNSRIVVDDNSNETTSPPAANSETKKTTENASSKEQNKKNTNDNTDIAATEQNKQVNPDALFPPSSNTAGEGSNVTNGKQKEGFKEVWAKIKTGITGLASPLLAFLSDKWLYVLGGLMGLFLLFLVLALFRKRKRTRITDIRTVESEAEEEAKAKHINRSNLRSTYDSRLLKFVSVAKDKRDDPEWVQSKFYKYFKKENIKKPEHQKILLEEILEFHRRATPDEQALLEDVYVMSDLATASALKLESYEPQDRIEGINELVEMNIYEALPNIYTLTNDSSPAVSNVAIRSYMVLFMNTPADMMSNPDFELSPEEQNIIVEQIKAMPEYQRPDFISWLKYPNNDVICLALKLIGATRETSAFKKVIPFMVNKDEHIRHTAIQTNLTLQPEQSKLILKKIYVKKDNFYRKEILNIFTQIASEEDLPFLEAALLKSKQQDLRQIAAKAMVQAGPKGSSRLKYLEQLGKISRLDFLEAV